MRDVELRLTDRVAALGEKLTTRYGRQTAAIIATIATATAFLRLS